jgi:hypothetical protein
MKKGDHWSEERRIQMTTMIKKWWQSRRENIPIRFWRKVDIRGRDECWEWKAGDRGCGYGTFCIYGKAEGAHRMAFLLSGGILTKDKPCVLHTCDNPACCNPNHLFAGSFADNTRDMIKKGRRAHNCGERAGGAKLKEIDVHEIRKLKDIISAKEISNIFGVSESCIYSVLNKSRWKHI